MNDSPQTDGLCSPQCDAATLRASDAERERTASRLRRAASQGRLQPDEHAQRLEAAYTAQTYGELDLLVSDLPTEHELARPRRLAQAIPAWLKAVAMLVVTALTVLVLTALVAGIEFGHSSAAAPNQSRPQPSLNAVDR